MKRVLHFLFIVSFAAFGWLIFANPAKAQSSSDVGKPTQLTPGTPLVVVLPVSPLSPKELREVEPFLINGLNSLVPSMSEKFFNEGREALDQQIQRLTEHPRKQEPLLKISPEVLPLRLQGVAPDSLLINQE